nr:hypothetical protein [Skermanella mucosa]
MALFGQLPAALREFCQIQNSGLVRIEQALIGLGQPTQALLNVLLGRLLLRGAGLDTGTSLSELHGQLGRIIQERSDVLPDRPLQIIGPGHPLRARCRSGAQSAILAVAAIIATLRLRLGGTMSDAEHGKPAGLARQKIAKQVIVLGVVTEGQSGIASQLGLRALPSRLINDRRHRDRDPFLPGPQLPARRFAPSPLRAWPVSRNVDIAVGVDGTGTCRVRQDVMDGRW